VLSLGRVSRVLAQSLGEVYWAPEWEDPAPFPLPSCRETQCYRRPLAPTKLVALLTFQ
jgi:hypothetical protein